MNKLCTDQLFGGYYAYLYDTRVSGVLTPGCWVC